MVISSLVGLLIALAVLAVIVWVIVQLFEPPPKIAQVVWVIGLLIALVLVADFFGVLGGVRVR